MVSGRSPNQKVKTLLEIKDAANALLEEGHAQEAAEQYSIALLRLKELAQEVQSGESVTLKALLLANRSQANLKLEDWEQALADAEACLAIQPDHPKALHRRSVAKEALDRAAQRRSHGEALKQALFCKSAGNQLLAERHFEAAGQRYSEGLEWLEDLELSGPALEVHLALLANRCQASLKRSRWSEALQDAEAVLSREPSHAKARYRRAKALLELGQCEEATLAVEELDASNEDVAELLRRLAAPAERRPAAAGHASTVETVEAETTELVRGRHTVVERQVEEDAEAKRLWKEAEKAWARQDYRRAISFAEGAQLELEWLRAEEQREKARPLAQQLLAVHVMQVRCHVALRDFATARGWALRALQFHRHEEERLQETFGMAHALRSSAPLLETMEAVAMGVEALHSFSAPLEPHLKSLEQADFCSPLRAALLARRAQLGRGAEAEADARRALMLDANCRDAQEILRRHKQGYNNE
ncbi:unnamed protein product [Durusdinium trenchii]|uniref:Uncharacterized protein n=2 Tax=Durusdinium trenchii TaxID=1381693 RepID=A0ABP0PA18_9DINO